jgi:methionyl-tRNA formyltransferase|tara:strand:+ start:118 stop:639 length:522 start_codon:yes stop_codon:yes gene_type:complete
MLEKTIRIFTRERERELIEKFMNSLNIPYEIYTSKDNPKLEAFELGVSYNYTKKIEPPLLYLARKGFINYHPAPLPEYPSGPKFELETTERAIKEKVMEWGVTLHYMNEEYDKGPIIRKMMFDLEEPPQSRDEIGSLTHWHLWKLFKNSVLEVYHFGNVINEKFIDEFEKENT